MADEGSDRTFITILMAKSKNYSLAIWLITLCLFLLSILTITKNAFPQDERDIQRRISRLKIKSAFDRQYAAETFGGNRPRSQGSGAGPN